MFKEMEGFNDNVKLMTVALTIDAASCYVSKSHVAPRPPRRYFTNFLVYGYSVWGYGV